MKNSHSFLIYYISTVLSHGLSETSFESQLIDSLTLFIFSCSGETAVATAAVMQATVAFQIPQDFAVEVDL